MAEAQNYANHRRFYPLHHFIAAPIALLGALGAIANLVIATVWFRGYRGVIEATVILLIALAVALAMTISRLYAMKVQDRVIALEVGERYERLSGKPFAVLCDQLSVKQIVALRFASDGELVPMAQAAAEKNTKPGDIKKSIKEWRADERRV
ncbi:hypothetical protein IT570_12120 [Candidatus Sumerlaeota bacterium]|nr:hypothetical protein [Candidatus Sumerlaeota bacterium]